jgi:hypothetical protein
MALGKQLQVEGTDITSCNYCNRVLQAQVTQVDVVPLASRISVLTEKLISVQVIKEVSALLRL